MRARGEVVTEVAEGSLDGTEDLVVGEIDEFVGEAFEEVVGRPPQGLKELLTPRFASLRGRVRSRSGFVQRGNLPGVRSIVARSAGSIFP